MRLSAHHLAEHYVKNIITKTKGDDLSELKSITDCKGDVNSMHKLVYSDIRNETTQKEILQFIYQQAKIQAAHNQVLPEPSFTSLVPSFLPFSRTSPRCGCTFAEQIGSRAGKRRGRFAWRKILSDIDDTLSCSGGSWPAGTLVSSLFSPSLALQEASVWAKCRGP